MLVQLQGREVWYLQLNEAVSRRLVELMQERGMTQYQLYMKSGVAGFHYSRLNVENVR
jgi:hypothetical protein